MSKFVPYHYVEHKETEEGAFKISEGKYMGLVWNYKKVKLPVIDNKGNPIDLEEAYFLLEKEAPAGTLSAAKKNLYLLFYFISYTHIMFLLYCIIFYLC